MGPKFGSGKQFGVRDWAPGPGFVPTRPQLLAPCQEMGDGGKVKARGNKDPGGQEQGDGSFPTEPNPSREASLGIADLRFDRPAGVGSEAQGNIYVAHRGRSALGLLLSARCLVATGRASFGQAKPGPVRVILHADIGKESPWYAFQPRNMTPAPSGHAGRIRVWREV
jgi:hypothetical protein